MYYAKFSEGRVSYSNVTASFIVSAYIVKPRDGRLSLTLVEETPVKAASFTIRDTAGAFSGLRSTFFF